MSPELFDIIRETTEITGAAQPDLTGDQAPVLVDTALSEAEEAFYLVGLIGGKDVGKSALVNALVGREISERTSHGPGTETVIAYAHHDQDAAVRKLLDLEVPGRYRIVSHQIDELRRQVLLDLPDIDSHYADHVEITRRMLRHMLYPIWIQSIEKYADQQPQQLLQRVAAGNSPANFLFCLNKVDYLRGDRTAGQEIQDDYASRLAKTLNLTQPPRVWMISAVQPAHLDLPGLRDQLMREKSVAVVKQSQQSAVRQQGLSVLSWLNQQNLPARAERLARLQEDAGEMISEQIGVPLLDHALPRLVEQSAQRTGLLDQCMRQRVARWPIVSIVHVFLAAIVSLWRHAFGQLATTSISTSGSIIDPYLPPPHRSLAHRIQSTFAQLHQAFPSIAPLYRQKRLWEPMNADMAAADLERRIAIALERQQTVLAERAAGRDNVVAGLFRMVLTLGALVWFPIIQPLLQAFLLARQGVSLDLPLEIVRILSVTFLLQNLSFLLLYYAVLWLILRWSTQRRIDRQLTRRRQADAMDPTLSLPAQALEWLQGLLDPVRLSRERMDALVQRTEQLRSNISSAA